MLLKRAFWAAPWRGATECERELCAALKLEDGVEDQDRDNDGIEDKMDRPPTKGCSPLYP